MCLSDCFERIQSDPVTGVCLHAFWHLHHGNAMHLGHSAGISARFDVFFSQSRPSISVTTAAMHTLPHSYFVSDITKHGILSYIGAILAGSCINDLDKRLLTRSTPGSVVWDFPGRQYPVAELIKLTTLWVVVESEGTRRLELYDTIYWIETGT